MTKSNDKEKLRIGILGAGGIARRRILPALQNSGRVDVAAVMDPWAAAEIAAEFGVPRHYEEAAALVDDAGVEAVYVASPAHLHAEHIALAARAGKPVFCEKPAARNFEEAAAALESCREQGVPFMEGYMMNFHGAHRRIRELIESGAIGRPVSMRAQLSCWYPPIPGAWRQDPAKGGGGSLIDMATHGFSLLEFLTGDRIDGVFAMTTSQVHDYPSEDSATTLLRFDSGTHATVDTFFCVRDESSLNRLEIYGDAGAILAEGTIGQGEGGPVQILTTDPGTGYNAQQDRENGSAWRPLVYEPVNPYAAEFEHFSDAVSAGRNPEINGPEEALHLARVTDAAYRSWREKKFISL